MATQHPARILVASFLSLYSARAWAFPRSVEHAFGDGYYYPGGELRELKLKNRLELVRPALSSSQRSELENAIKKGGFYKLRVKGGQGDHPLHVSIPARCLVIPGNKESFVAATSYTGELIGLSYDMSEMQCDPLETVTPSEVLLAMSAPVTVREIAPAPPVAKQPAVLEVKRPAQKAAAGSGQQRKGDKADGEGEEESPPPDERTWLQKNWIYLVPVAFMLLNGLGGGGAQQRQAAPAQAAGAARQRARQ